MARSHTPLVVVGGGMAADAAVRGIRAVDANVPVVVLTSEPDPPYDRPPLSKGLWSGMAEDRIRRNTGDEPGVEVRTGTAVRRVLPDSSEVVTAHGERIPYRGLVLATGARPRRIPGPPGTVLPFRDLASYRRLREWVDAGRRIAIVGGGFIGTELAASLRNAGAAVSLHFPEPHPLALHLPDPLPSRVHTLFRDHGVDVHPGRLVRDASEVPGGEGIVAGIGVVPRTELAVAAGLEVKDGIRTDATLRTSRAGIYAAGDVVSAPLSLSSGRHVRLEHESQANESGVCAGMGAAGEPQVHDPVPTFYSGFFGITWEGFGLLESDAGGPSLHLGETVESPGVAIYRRGGHLCGLLVWNRPGSAARAQRLLRAGGTPSDPEVLSALGAS